MQPHAFLPSTPPSFFPSSALLLGPVSTETVNTSGQGFTQLQHNKAQTFAGASDGTRVEAEAMA